MDWQRRDRSRVWWKLDMGGDRSAAWQEGPRADLDSAIGFVLFGNQYVVCISTSWHEYDQILLGVMLLCAVRYCIGQPGPHGGRNLSTCPAFQRL